MPRKPTCQFTVVQAATASGVRTSKVLEMSKAQWTELKSIFIDYGMTMPRWLMTSTRLTRPRRKVILDLLADSGLDSEWCAFVQDDDSWSTILHKLYHAAEVLR